MNDFERQEPLNDVRCSPEDAFGPDVSFAERGIAWYGAQVTRYLLDADDGVKTDDLSERAENDVKSAGDWSGLVGDGTFGNQYAKNDDRENSAPPPHPPIPLPGCRTVGLVDGKLVVNDEWRRMSRASRQGAMLRAWYASDAYAERSKRDARRVYDGAGECGSSE